MYATGVRQCGLQQVVSSVSIPPLKQFGSWNCQWQSTLSLSLSLSLSRITIITYIYSLVDGGPRPNVQPAFAVTFTSTNLYYLQKQHSPRPMTNFEPNFPILLSNMTLIAKSWVLKRKHLFGRELWVLGNGDDDDGE